MRTAAGGPAAFADWLKALPGSPRCFALPSGRQDAGGLGSTKCRELEASSDYAAASTPDASLDTEQRALQTPTVAQLLDLCLAMESHLEQQPSNVAVVRCQCSCRAALMLLSAYLLVKVRAFHEHSSCATGCPTDVSCSAQGIVKQPAAAAKAVLAKLPCSLPAAQPSELRYSPALLLVCCSQLQRNSCHNWFSAELVCLTHNSLCCRYLRQVLVTLEAGAGADVPEQPLHLRTLKLQGAPSRCEPSQPCSAC